ncbi:prepilin-type N-terminal cleavage/methylation domain-containing protein [Xanthobacter autotrophicus]|uniref:prepilin-type N-terminal cleavage/methylation domain-containing protein n=1 Tax=Xanthobacter autotrophicus TaxID=280 RepID=UPI0037277A03
MSRASSPDALAGGSGRAGFTLLEVLVALAVAAAVLAAIGQLMGANARGVRALETRAGLLSTARAVEAGIPARSSLALGRTDGDIAGHRWRMDVRPLDVAGVPEGAKWAPRDVVIRVRAPSGAMVVLETVRLVPVAAE